MRHVARPITMTFALVCLLVGALLMFAPVSAQTAERCFTETGFCISGAIRTAWERDGGLPVFGLPIGPQQQSQFEGKNLTFQLFERQRIELHPENAAPYDLLFGRLGVERLVAQGRDWQVFPRTQAQAGCQFFAETGHNVCQPFLARWRAAGAASLARYGLPISDLQTEDVNGKLLTIQWFERARFELHPENQPPFDILLGLLGSESAVGSAVPPVANPPVAAQPTSAPTTTTTTVSGPTTIAEPTEVTRPTNTRVPATTAPNQPTATPRPPVNTPVPTDLPTTAPTNTPVPTTPPTNTAVPTNTPRPTSVFQPPSTSPTPPTGLPPNGGLPSNNLSAQDIPSLTAATTTITIGSVNCFNLPTPPLGTAINYTITGPDNQPQQLTLAPVTGSDGKIRWGAKPGLALGVYTISAVGTGAPTPGAGTPVPTPIAGAFTLVDRPAAASATGQGKIVVVREVASVNPDSIRQCNDGVGGSPGDTFSLLLSGFYPGEQLTLYLYGTPGCPTQACYLTTLPPVTVDAKGQQIVTLRSEATDPEGGYIILTSAQAKDLNSGPNPGDFPAGALEQRLTLRNSYR